MYFRGRKQPLEDRGGREAQTLLEISNNQKKSQRRNERQASSPLCVHCCSSEGRSRRSPLEASNEGDLKSSIIKFQGGYGWRELKRTHLSVSADRGSSDRQVGEPPLPLPNLRFGAGHEQTVVSQAAAWEQRRSRLQKSEMHTTGQRWALHTFLETVISSGY
jgi:hypothetical protein